MTDESKNGGTLPIDTFGGTQRGEVGPMRMQTPLATQTEKSVCVGCKFAVWLGTDRHKERYGQCNWMPDLSPPWPVYTNGGHGLVYDATQSFDFCPVRKEIPK